MTQKLPHNNPNPVAAIATILAAGYLRLRAQRVPQVNDVLPTLSPPAVLASRPQVSVNVTGATTPSLTKPT